MNKQKQINAKQYNLKYLFLIIALFTITPSRSQDALGAPQTPNAILKKVHNKLNSLNKIHYDLTIEYNFPSND